MRIVTTHQPWPKGVLRILHPKSKTSWAKIDFKNLHTINGHTYPTLAMVKVDESARLKGYGMDLVKLTIDALKVYGVKGCVF